MQSPAFATVDDLATRMGGLESCSTARAQARIDDASALIHFHTANRWVDPLTGELVAATPAITLTICCAAAERSLRNPLGVVQQATTTGPFSDQVTFGDVSADVYLRASEIAALKRAAGITGGLAVISTTRGPLETGSVNGASRDLVDGVETDPIRFA